MGQLLRPTNCCWSQSMTPCTHPRRTILGLRLVPLVLLALWLELYTTCLQLLRARQLPVRQLVSTLDAFAIMISCGHRDTLAGLAGIPLPLVEDALTEAVSTQPKTADGAVTAETSDILPTGSKLMMTEDYLSRCTIE